MLFGLKKIIESLLLPLPIGLLLLLVGLFLLWTREAKTLRNTGFIAGFLVIFIFSLNPVAVLLINGLQSQYKPLITLPGPISRVVVLGSSASAKKDLPANITLGSTSLARLTEGVRVFKLIQTKAPYAQLVLSGGRAFQSASAAGSMKNTAMIFGVDPAKIVIEDGSLDTHDEATFLQKTLQDEPFILVTSAYHMPRAMALFEKLGMHPIAAPTEFINISPNFFTRYLPNASSLRISDIAIHEYLGIFVAKLKGTIN